MKKISRRSFLAVCGTLAAATALTACGGSSSSTASSAAASSSEAASVEVQDVALKVWGPQEDQVDSSSWLPTMCEQFNDAHPEWNITFTYEVCSEGDASKNVTQDVSAAADVYMFANDQLGTLVQANAIAQLGGSYLDEVLNDNPDTMIDSVTSTDGGVYGRDYTLTVDLPAMGSFLLRLTPEAPNPDAARISANKAMAQKRRTARAKNSSK